MGDRSLPPPATRCRSILLDNHPPPNACSTRTTRRFPGIGAGFARARHPRKQILITSVPPPQAATSIWALLRRDFGGASLPSLTYTIGCSAPRRASAISLFCRQRFASSSGRRTIKAFPGIFFATSGCSRRYRSNSLDSRRFFVKSSCSVIAWTIYLDSLVGRQGALMSRGSHLHAAGRLHHVMMVGRAPSSTRTSDPSRAPCGTTPRKS